MEIWLLLGSSQNCSLGKYYFWSVFDPVLVSSRGDALETPTHPPKKVGLGIHSCVTLACY